MLRVMICLTKSKVNNLPFLKYGITPSLQACKWAHLFIWGARHRRRRHVGDFHLNMRFIVICPEEDYDEGTDSLLPKMPFIDPDWSLEQIIGKLAGFKSEDIDPF